MGNNYFNPRQKYQFWEKLDLGGLKRGQRIRETY